MAKLIWLVCGVASLQGCVSLNVNTAPIAAVLPGIAAQYGRTAAPAATSPGAVGVCENGAVPASGAYIGSAILGEYGGVAMPASFTAYQAEREVTERITGFARDTSSTGLNTWTAFQCLYPSAVAVWRRKASEPIAAAPPTPMPYEPPPAAAPPEPVPAGDECPAIIDPANGTVNGTPDQGAYEGALLPGSFAVYDSQDAISERIARFAADDTPQGRNTWFKFQCFYAQAVAVWREAG